MLGCEWDDRTLYVLFAEQVGRDGAASRPAVAALELPGGKLRWKQRLSTDDVFLALSPLQRFGSYLTLTATPDDAISPCRPLVIDTLKGTVTAFTPDTRTGYAFRRPAGWSGSPVLLNGKLILEEPKGTVFITGSL
jgi:hypothetical protein